MGVDQEIDNFYFTIQTINNTLYTLDTELEPILEQLDGALGNLDAALEDVTYTVKAVSDRVVDVALKVPNQWVFLLLIFLINLGLLAIAVYLARYSFIFIRDGRHRFHHKKEFEALPSQVDVESEAPRAPPPYGQVLASYKYRDYTPVSMEP
ncbi:hypothetical protein PFISCL1PPCAC_2535 [Pristionchus fissidentatus]|uniref:Plasma membrane fusion protein PRM1 n=1 Tax=Pristionchus fissidentatus TaxID=1538716 RepID=A0AAV5UWX0_9BILA|nr:hypothetical protein PFISCL1PPCAC_2535 [Pristionchus fissidentatus]